MLVHRVRVSLGASLTVLALGIASAAPVSAVAHIRPHHVKRHHVNHHPHPGIPQHNGGDRDTDNNGARSDGEGGV